MQAYTYKQSWKTLFQICVWLMQAAADKNKVQDENEGEERRAAWFLFHFFFFFCCVRYVVAHYSLVYCVVILLSLLGVAGLLCWLPLVALNNAARANLTKNK